MKYTPYQISFHNNPYFILVYIIYCFNYFHNIVYNEYLIN
nr:MAG TPA: hypothetical protein [Caudoviricetes sp.]